MDREFPKVIENESFMIIAYSDNTAELKRYLGNDPEVVIPSQIDCYTIRNISQMAFGNCDSLKSVVIPEGIIYIGVSAFYNCVNLEHVSLPESLETIFIGAFIGCGSLRILEIPDNVSQIEPSAVRYLTDIEIHVTPDSETDKQMGKKHMGFVRKKTDLTEKGKKVIWIRRTDSTEL